METKSYKTNRSLEDKFQYEIKSILGNYFITKDIQADLKEGADFLILKMTPFRIACRLRRNKYYKFYPDEFTIRWKNPNGYKTEYAKIMEGLVDFLFYGFLDEEETKIINYFIGNLVVFRNTEVNKTPIIKTNGAPDYNEFAAYKIDRFPKTFILERAKAVTNNKILPCPEQKIIWGNDLFDMKFNQNFH